VGELTGSIGVGDGSTGAAGGSGGEVGSGATVVGVSGPVVTGGRTVFVVASIVGIVEVPPVVVGAGRSSMGRTVGVDVPSVRATTAASPNPTTAATTKASTNIAARRAPERRERASCAAATVATLPERSEQPVRSA
jgi:hypothetical protein